MTVPIIGLALPTDAQFEDIRIGMTAMSPERLSGDTGPGRLATLAELAGSVRPCRAAELVALDWKDTSNGAGGVVHLMATVTRCGTSSDRDAARIVQDLRVLDAMGAQVQQARAQWRVPSIKVSADPARLCLEFGSVQWGRRIGERLSRNAAFISTTTPFDGAIGFSSGSDEVSFRIYRGQLVEVARKAVEGPTFTIDADELTWLSLLTGPTNDFVRRTMTGAFRVRGNGFQYVRMIKAIVLVLDEARAEVLEAHRA